ncbi:hypothetical protein K1T71_008831 [Dendrolimus kikuchii]|uniref:Uncharacterized protein n=1 Tax=Dendrolimus kikuchii TaxID=765133 RepID=A0ACC1CX26_9NEOP|nr:hypothetical protein K1T71_008831 [Dendrolimus kikuchii]
MFPLFTNKHSGILAEMFTALTSIQVDYEDGLPSQTCSTCQNLIIQCYEFKVQCEKADYTLKSVLRGEFIIKQEPCFKNTGALIEQTKVRNVEEPVMNESKLSEAVSSLLTNSQCPENHIENKETNESDALYIIRNNTSKEKNDYEVSVTDSKTLLNQIISEKCKQRKKKRKIYKCSSCPKKFLKLCLLKEHRKVEHNTESQLHSCDHCKDLFNSEHDLKLHLLLHTKGSIWKCSECHKEFNGKNELSRHIKRHMDSKKYPCERCPKSFAELYSLRRHARVHTGETLEKKHACHLCDKRYTESSALANHLKRHSGARPCVCSVCGKDFPNRRLLRSHTLVHSDNKAYQCNYCDKRFRHESTRNTHQRLHTGEKPYICSCCGKTFVQGSNLTLHMRTHTGERPYACTDCGRRFTSGSSLKMHVRTHTGERPFACNVCGKSFARQNLRMHMRQHNGERPHECSVCAKTFAKATRLKEHLRTHTGEKPFECVSCSRKFPTKTNLTSHMKTHEEKKKKMERKVIINPKRQVTDNICMKSVDNISNEQVGINVNKELLIHGDNKVETNIIIVGHNSDDNNISSDHEIPLSLNIDKEVLIQDDNSIETNILVVDSTQNDSSLNSNTVHIIDNDINNYTNDMKLVSVNEGEVSIASSGVIEGAIVKLYQLDQSLVQIHSAGGQVTISKITSKMTANF